MSIEATLGSTLSGAVIQASDPRALWLARLDNLNEAIQAHPGMQARDRWSEIKCSLDVFDRNALELLALLRAVEHEPDLEMALLAQPEPEDNRPVQDGVRIDGSSDLMGAGGCEQRHPCR